MEAYGYDSVVKSHCRMCHGGCGVLVYTRDGSVMKISGDPNCPINHGTLCTKGIASAQLAYHPDRLTYPVRRVGPKASGKWERISWDEALDTIAERILDSVSEDGPKTVDDKLAFVFQVNVCRHCDDPPCAVACPEEAIAKREDGIVLMDYETCTGCQACIEVCPCAAIAFDTKKDLAQKCNLCHHRVDKGLLPACADNVCLAHAIYFGDPEEINEMILRRQSATPSLEREEATKALEIKGDGMRRN